MASKKPQGYFEKLLAIDSETTGLDFDNDDVSNGHQALSWGIIVADAKTLEPIEELYVEIKYNAESKKRRQEDKDFGVSAAAIHGLSFKYLEENGMEEVDAVLKIAELILKYWGPTCLIKTLGHNVHLFDVPFLRAMFRRFDIPLKFGSRHYDTNSLGYLTTGAYNSNALFETMGYEDRDTHNALDDIKMTLESARIIKVLWKDKVGLMAYE